MATLKNYDQAFTDATAQNVIVELFKASGNDENNSDDDSSLTATTELAEPIELRPGTQVLLTSASASSRGSGDVIEISADLSTTMRIGYYLEHTPVQPCLVYSTERTLERSDDYKDIHVTHVKTPQISAAEAAYINTPPSTVKGTKPSTTDGNGHFYVPLFSQASAALGCAKLLPLLSEPLNDPGSKRVIGYKFAANGRLLVGRINPDNPTEFKPFTKKLTLKIPKGNYSPTDLVSLLNRQLAVTSAVTTEAPVENGTPLVYPNHTPHRIAFSSPLQTYTDAIPAEYDGVFGLSADPNTLHHCAVPVEHWYFDSTTITEFPYTGPYPYYDYAASIQARHVRLGKDHSPFHAFTLGGLEPRFRFDTDRSRFELTGLHQYFTQRDAEETAYPDAVTMENGGKPHPNRVSLSFQAAMGIDYARQGGPFDEKAYAAPSLDANADALTVVGFTDPSIPKAGAITHFNGAFVLDWWVNESDKAFWRKLGFTQALVMQRLSKNAAGWYNAHQLWRHAVANSTDNDVKGVLTARASNVIGLTNFEPPFGSTYALQHTFESPSNIPAKGPPMPLWRGDPSAHHSAWHEITWLTAEQLITGLTRIYYSWFAPPFYKEGDSEKYDPMAANLPNINGTRFCISTDIKPIVAEQLPEKLESPCVLVVTDLPIQPYRRHILPNGHSVSVLGIISKQYDVGDWLSSQSAGQVITLRDATTLKRMSIRLINPDGSRPANLDGKLSARVVFTIPPPVPEPLAPTPAGENSDHGQPEAKRAKRLEG